MTSTLRGPAGIFARIEESPLTRDTLVTSRQTISLRIARLLALLVLLITLPAAQIAITDERWPALFAFVVGISLIWYAALTPRRSYQIRTIVIVLALYLVMAGEAAIYGLVVDAMPYALLTVILTTILLNSWAGLASLLISGVLLTIAGSLTRAGVIELSAPHIEAYLNGRLWIWVVVKICHLPAGNYLSITLVVGGYLSLTTATKRLTQALTQEHQLLARRIATRPPGIGNEPGNKC